MIDLRPAKNIQGAVTLPISPDLLFMAALGACAVGRKISVSGINDTDVIKDIVKSISGLAMVDIHDGTMTVSPKSASNDPAILLTLPESLSPYQTTYLFMGLGMGKTVVIRSAPQKLLDAHIARGKRVGITIETVAIDTSNPETIGLRATDFDRGIAENSSPSEDDCAGLLAYLFGNGGKLTFAISDYHLTSPLRQLAAAFGMTVSAKQVEEDDPILKRMRFMKSRQKDAGGQSQRFIVEADFSNTELKAKSTSSTGDENLDNDNIPAQNITVPGDEILAAALITLKCLIPKGDLEISNVPLESWGTQAMQFIKKMGGKIDVKGSAKTAFGASGTVTVQKSECFGRKIKCAPIYQYAGQLPCMTVAAAFADGKSVFRELSPLRLTEPDELDMLEKSLRPLGVRHGEMPDGIVVEGAKDFDGFDIIEPMPAHIAVAFCVAGLKCMGKTSIADDHVYARWPQFEKMLGEICEFRNKG